MPLSDFLAISMDQLLIVYGVLFVGTVLLVESLFHLVMSHRFGPEAKINRRLRMLESGIDPREVLMHLKHRRAEQKPASFRHPIDWLEWMIIVAGLQIPVRRFIVIMSALAMLVAAVVKLTGAANLLIAVAIGVVCGVTLPVLVLRFLQRRRLKRFSEQLPEAIDLIVRSLRAGHPLNAGLNMVANELPDPIGTEFGIAVDETTYGLDLREAIANMGRRIDLLDLHYFTIAVRIQYGTGGNLAEILENLSRLIRSRFQMFRKVRAITAEGRLSAWFLSIFPIGLGAALISIKPDYYEPVRDNPLFPWIAGVAATLLLLNVVVMRRMVSFKI